MLTPFQLAQRLEGITATDVAAIVGVHPYRSRIDVWREKRGELPPWDGNLDTKWGERVEPALRAHYADIHDVRLELPGTLVHPDHDWMMASPDAIVYTRGDPNPLRGLECKQHNYRLAWLYGAPGSDEIPLYEFCQCMWCIAVTGLTRWDEIAVLGGTPVEFIVDRDDDLIAELQEHAYRFLIDNVRGGAVPEPDGSERFETWITERWKANPGALIDIGDDNDTFTLIERARAILKNQDELDDEIAKIKQRLKLRIADSEGLTWKDANGKPQKLTWKRNKPSKVIDHVQIVHDMRDDARLTMSAVAKDIDRAMVCLASAGYDSIGSSTRATVNAHEVLELVKQLSRAMVTIIERTDSKYTTEIPGNRPFNWPKTWNKTKEQK
jgi:putative phage-type endonuclease